MPVTDPTAIAFSNSKLRPAADKLAQLNYWFEAILDEFDRRTADAPGGVFIPDDAGEEIIDGAQTDGRPVVDGAKLRRLLVLMAGYRTQFSGVMDDILAIAVNPHPGVGSV